MHVKSTKQGRIAIRPLLPTACFFSRLSRISRFGPAVIASDQRERGEG